MITGRDSRGDGGQDGLSEDDAGVREAVRQIRTLYAADPGTVVAGSVGVLAAVVLLVGYALGVSPTGTVVALLAWLAFTGALARNGVGYRALRRSALGAGFYFVGIPTATRLVTDTTEVASSASWAGFSIPNVGAALIVLFLAKFTTVSLWTYRSR